MDRRVTPPKWVTLPTLSSPPLCKQALRSYSAAIQIKVVKIIFIIMLYKLVPTFSIPRLWIKVFSGTYKKNIKAAEYNFALVFLVKGVNTV